MFCLEWNSIKDYKMNKIVNRFLLAGDKFMLEMHLKSPDLLIVLLEHLLKINKEYNNLKKQGIQDICTEMSLIKLAFNIWLMEILKT